MIPLAVTTAASPPPELETRARQIADELRAPYFPRRNITAARLFDESDTSRLLFVERERLLLRDSDGASYFFHPNLMLVRGLNLRRGMRDVFADAIGIQTGETMLDCTVGFAAEATLAAFLTGETGKITGLESVPELAIVTREGLKSFQLATWDLEAAMRRIEIVTADYREFLASAASKRFDIVYFDPFFDERLPGSENSVSPLHVFGNHAPLDADAVKKALRVAKKRVVIKHPKREPLPPEIASLTTAVVSGRKSKVQYSVLEAPP